MVWPDGDQIPRRAFVAAVSAAVAAARSDFRETPTGVSPPIRAASSFGVLVTSTGPLFAMRAGAGVGAGAGAGADFAGAFLAVFSCGLGILLFGLFGLMSVVARRTSINHRIVRLSTPKLDSE